MKTNLDSIHLLKEHLLSDSTAAIRALDTSKVTFDDQYYRKRRHNIRLYKQDLLTNTLEKLLIYSLSGLLFLLLLALIFVFPLIPMIGALIVIIKIEEKRYDEADTLFRRNL